jgi:RimJ/RimL family protein N-acetyltransferase
MRPDDLDTMAELLGDPDVMRFYPAPKTRAETREGGFVGDCGLTWQLVNGTRELEVGYHVRTLMQGLGYATEAASACRDLARAHIESGILVAIVHPDNLASARVAEKLGMSRAADDRDSLPPRHVWRMRLR